MISPPPLSAHICFVKGPISCHWVYSSYIFIDQLALCGWCGLYNFTFPVSILDWTILGAWVNFSFSIMPCCILNPQWSGGIPVWLATMLTDLHCRLPKCTLPVTCLVAVFAFRFFNDISVNTCQVKGTHNQFVAWNLLRYVVWVDIF